MLIPNNVASPNVPTDPALLPRTVALRILTLAYGFKYEDSNSDVRTYMENNPLRVVAPLVSKRWQQLLKTEEAHKLLWHRVRVYDSFIPRNFDLLSFSAFWAPRSLYILELDVDLKSKDPSTLVSLSNALSGLIGAALNLKSLRVTGPLAVGSMFSTLGDQLSQLTTLSSIYLAGGSPTTWQLEDAVTALSMLPSLQKVEVRFNK